MKRMIAMNLCNIVNDLQFKMVFGIYFVMNIFGFFLCVRNDVGTNIIYIRSAYENFILQGTETTFIVVVMTLIFPIMSAVMATFSFRKDETVNRDPIIVSRCGRKKYVLSYIISCGILSFVGTVLPFIVNMLLCYAIYPLVGNDNAWLEHDYLIGFNSYNPNRLLDMLRLQSPALYNCIYILIWGFIATGIGIAAAALSIKADKKAIVKMSDGRMWEVLTARYFSAICLPDCTVMHVTA